MQLVDQRIYNTQRHPVNNCQHLGSQGEPIPRWANLEFYLGLVWLVWLRFFLMALLICWDSFSICLCQKCGEVPQNCSFNRETYDNHRISAGKPPHMPWNAMRLARRRWVAIQGQGACWGYPFFANKSLQYTDISEYKHENVMDCGGSMAQSEINYVYVHS